MMHADLIDQDDLLGQMRARGFDIPAGASAEQACEVVVRGLTEPNARALKGMVEQMYTGSANTFYALAAQRRIASYFNLGRNLSAWRNWLATKGPILTRLDVDDAFMQATATKGKLDTYTANSGLGGHCVALVGYVNGRFIVRNSWGTGWGDKGFAHAADSYAQPAFTEAFGVVL